MKKRLTKTQARIEAKKILKKDRSNFALRSCWKCNGAHEHLKDSSIPIACFSCGRWYFKGVDITEGREVVPTDIKKIWN